LRSNARPRFALAALFVAGAGLAPSPSLAAEDLAVIVNPAAGVNQLSLTELRKIYLGDRQFWPSGEPVTLLVHAPPAPERRALLRTLYRMNEAQFKQYWIAKVFRAEAATSPKTVLSGEMALKLVDAIPGAVAVVRSGDVPRGRTVLRLDGLSPGQAGYPITLAGLR